MAASLAVAVSRFARMGSVAAILVLGWPALGASGPVDAAVSGPAADWVCAGLNTNRLVWGVRGGLLWGLPEGSIPRDGPRGLIRLWYPTLPDGGYDLINFIAIEPVVNGRRGFSELEPSALDATAGKRLWRLETNSATGTPVEASPHQRPRLRSAPGTGPDSPDFPETGLGAGDIRRRMGSALTVRVGVERFLNGAHVALRITQRAEAPGEIELSVHAQPDSAPIEYCLLTATMGNKARARQLWLGDGPVSSRKLYGDYRESGFAPHRRFALDRLYRAADGDCLVAITTDEADPSAVNPFPRVAHWRYAGQPVTQYWRKPAGHWRDDLHAVVNGRYTYWRSRHPIPGGVAFENFELEERFHQDQRFVFGLTRRTPVELGFPAGR